LKVIDIKEIIQHFNIFTDSLDFVYSIETGKAKKIIDKIKSNLNTSRLLIRIYCTIGVENSIY